eukprot:9063778-Pyramimonas_sp.AAC.1
MLSKDPQSRRRCTMTRASEGDEKDSAANEDDELRMTAHPTSTPDDFRNESPESPMQISEVACGAHTVA